MARVDLLETPSLPNDLGYTEEHGLLRGQVRRMLGERCRMSDVRRLAEDPLGYDRELWKEMIALGWLGLTAKEELGGSGLGSLYLALLLEEMGRALLPSPFFASLMALTALEQAGSAAEQRRLCPAVIRGEVLATLAMSEPSASWEPLDVQTTAAPVEGGYSITGDKTHVLYGASAAIVVLPCREPDGGLGLYVVELPARGAEVEPETSVDPTRRMARLRLDGVRVGKDARLSGDGLEALRNTFIRGYAMLAAEMVGGIDAVLTLTRDYAASRIQFGRPIGAFQAVKHPIVDMMIGCEWARSLSLGAAAVLDHDAERAEAIARMAKAQASDVYAFAVKKGVQLHGGFGFTWDCDVHFYFKRALWSRSTLGDAAHHRRHLAAALFDAS